MVLINKNFWSGKRILVTGHTGFKGSWLCLWLQTMNAKVYGLALQPATNPALFTEACVKDEMISIIGDIRDYETVHQAMKKSQPEIIIHMAAQPLVRYSYHHPLETYSINVMGAVNVFECARKIGSVRAIINVTTDKCYENKEQSDGYCEDDPMGGFDPYSSSKACSELVTKAYKSSFLAKEGIALSSARAGNVIGGGDWSSDRLIPDILRGLEYNENIMIRHPHAIRPWQHVLEPLSGYLTLAEKLFEHNSQFSEAWNFGPNDNDIKSVEWIVKEMAAKWGKNNGWQLDMNNHPYEATSLKLNISKAKSKLGWKPVWNLETAITNIVDWHKAWVNKEDANKICKYQIADYELALATN